MKRRGIISVTLLLLLVAAALGSVAAEDLRIGYKSKAGRAASALKVKMPEPALVGAAVSISNFQFAPKVVRVKAGAEVTWQVKQGSHTVSADDGSFESSVLSEGKKFSHTFSTPGSYRYFCSFHGSKGGHDMAGTVIVTK